MTKTELFENIKRKKSFLCVGLDVDVKKMPTSANSDIFAFNKAIIDATADLCVAYKPNTAFYESEGLRGWEALQRTVQYIREQYPDIFLIADAKRGDIGNTVAMYARAFFETMNFDAMTVAPYMGEDSVRPLLSYKDKWVILLALTSNSSARRLQMMEDRHGVPLFETVLQQSLQWGNANNMMYVAGATNASALEAVRRIVPESFLLVPGVGAQGGSLEQVAKYGMNKECGLIVNSSRQILYASSGKDFAAAARAEAQNLQKEMERLLLVVSG
ncbi:MAG: orotidine-5'-phosphate decarboxylase [Prevotellaceae bacterium]|jgi:orotidine-5'-phosphate decarboxylase|nr:orotidine-5'-phosphate decarboxylase [Prevotellaceae bacterium]